MTDVAAIVLGLALVVVGISTTLACIYWQRADAGYHVALDAAAASTRAQVVAEQERDSEHTARVAVETALADARKQLAATQAALDTAQKEWTSHVGDLVRSGSSADAVAAFEQLFQTKLPGAGHADPAAADRQGGAAGV